MANYWQASDKGGVLCSECDPAIGAWHGAFQKRQAAGMLVDDQGFLWSRKSVDSGQLPSSRRVVGVVAIVGEMVEIVGVRNSASTP